MVTTHHSRHLSARDRGIAMLLVIIALGAATVMTTGYLLSRRNSGAIGANAASSVATRWASRAAAEHALAVMQTPVDWRTQALDGRLFENVAFGNASASVVLTDLDGNSITGDERAVVLTSIANAGAVSSTTQWIVNVTPEPTVDNVIKPTLDEFSIYAVSSIEADPGATIAVWDKSPYAKLRPPLNIGISSPWMSALDISQSSTMVNSIAHLPPDAYSSLINYAQGNSQISGTEVLQTEIPVASASQSFYSSLPWLTVPSSDLRGSNTTTLAPGDYGNITVWLGATLVLDEANGQYYAFNDLRIETYATMQIYGDVTVEVTDDLRVLNRSTIELMTPDSSLTLLIGDNFEVKDSVVGLTRADGQNGSRDAFDVQNYIDTSKISVFSQITHYQQDYIFDDDAIVLGSIHAPTAKVEIKNDSDLIGRITAEELKLESNTTLLYDPALNPKLGITNTMSPLYATDGSIKTEFKNAFEAYDPSVGYELLKTYVDSSVGDFNSIIKDTMMFTFNPNSLSPRYSHAAWKDTWPTELYAYETHGINPVNTIDGVFVHPRFDITDLLVDPGAPVVVSSPPSGGGGGGSSKSAMTFVVEDSPF
ncbi:MAG: hypothetical protein ACF8GE_00380 [Phycisphaerales bacterium JB043]